MDTPDEKEQRPPLTANDESSAETLVPLLYKELRRVAANCIRGERDGHTLQPTALVNEAYLRLVGLADQNGRDHAEFVALASQTMRRVLVDHARKRGARKRGGGWDRVTLNVV